MSPELPHVSKRQRSRRAQGQNAKKLDIRARTNRILALGGCDEYISELLWLVDNHVVAAVHADELPASIIL